MANDKNTTQGIVEVERAIVTKGRGGKNNFPQVQFNESPDDTRQILGEVVRWSKLPKPQNDDEFEERLQYFFDECFKTGERPTVEKMALALGTYRDRLWDWENGRGCSQRRSDAIKTAKGVLAAYDAGLVITGKMQAVPYIFRAKNFYSMKDEQEVVLTPNNPLGNVDNPNEIAQKYEQLPEE